MELRYLNSSTYYIKMELVNGISLTLMNHQITHFMDDIDGMEVKVYYHDILYKCIFDIINLIVEVNELISYVMIDGIDYNDQCKKKKKGCDRVKTRNVLGHKLMTWFAKHVINYNVAAIDNYNHDYWILIMRRFKEISIIIYLHETDNQKKDINTKIEIE